MQFTIPKNDSKYHWTNHVIDKMRYYGISASIIKRIIRFPKRTEEGIALGTIAVMQSAGSKKNPSEIWVMYQTKQQNHKRLNTKVKTILSNLKGKDFSAILNPNKKIIISAWRYPGITTPGKPIPIPDDVLAELEQLL